jgi:hypothetical protein
MTPADVNSLVYVPCTFDIFTNKLQKIGSISKCVDSKSGAVIGNDGVKENDDATIVDVAKMVGSAMA